MWLLEGEERREGDGASLGPIIIQKLDVRLMMCECVSQYNNHMQAGLLFTVIKSSYFP